MQPSHPGRAVARGAGPAQGHALIDRHVLTGLRGLSDGHAHAAVDEETRAQPRAWMKLDPREESGEGGEAADQELEAAAPAPVGQPVEPDGVQPRVVEQDFWQAASGRIEFEDRADITPERVKHERVRSRWGLP